MLSRSNPSSAQYRSYVFDSASVSSQSQLVRSPRVHSFLRHGATIFAPVRRLSAHGAHTLWRPSPGSNPDRGASRCDGRGSMSMTRFSAAKMLRNGHSKSSGALIAESPRSRRDNTRDVNFGLEGATSATRCANYRWFNALEESTGCSAFFAPRVKCLTCLHFCSTRPPLTSRLLSCPPAVEYSALSTPRRMHDNMRHAANDLQRLNMATGLIAAR